MATKETIQQAMGNSYIDDFEAEGFNAAMILADINTVDRAAMWYAQVGHESDGMRTYREYADGSQYEWRADLGNNQPGDGVRFAGRGLIQVTGRHNYTEFSKWAYSKGYAENPTFFVDQPWLLETIKYGFLGASWYWTTQRRLNDLSDRRDIDGATRAINGGLNGIEDRRSRYRRCLAIGQALLPSESETEVASEAQQVVKELFGPEGKGWPVTLYHLPGQLRTLVAMVGEVYTKNLSKLSVTVDKRPRPLSEADDLLGHVLSLRAEVAQLKELVQKK